MMKIGQLFNKAKIALSLDLRLADTTITGLASDSRYLQSGDLFFAREGLKGHGLDYIDQLIEKGVAAIIYEGDYADRIPKNIPSARLDQQQLFFAQISQVFYGALIDQLDLVGVTGTEGKTSVTQFVAKALLELGQQCGLVGTNGIGFLDNLKENTHTTPDLIALYQSLAIISEQFNTAKFKPIALEVTSHALEQKRIEGLTFKVTALTNLSRDHLDYHKTIKSYADAKRKLFVDYISQSSVLNIDDSFGASIFDDLQENKSDRMLYPYGEKSCNHPLHLKMTDIELHHNGLRFALSYQDETYALSSQLYGRFNAYNLTAMIGILLAFGIEMKAIIPLIPCITNVKGRMERVALKNGAVGIVDYAHKPNALLEALTSLREHIHEGELIVVFGCGGDRDKGKRPLMAEISEKHADHIIITSDNPRNENPDSIIDEIMEGFSHKDVTNIERVSDRGDAINRALKRAQKGDIILIAGKGHEDYQIVGDNTLHFSDIEQLNRFNRE